MKLSDGEKLTLIMLAELYTKLGINGAIDPAFVTRAIYSDYAWALKWKYDAIFYSSEDVAPPEVKTVAKILTMWDLIESSLNALPPEERAEIKDAVGPLRNAFCGFGGNNEAEHRDIAKFMINDLGIFEEFKGRDLNSHQPMLERYGDMLAVFKSLWDKVGHRDFTGTELIEIFEAGC